MTMNMKKDILLLTALAGVMAWTGCQIVEEEIVQQQPEEQVEQDAAQDAVPTWTLTVLAERGIGTKGLEVDGDQATATLLKSVWKADEPVEVYLGSTHIGTLTATPDGLDAHKATLSGTVTTGGITPGSTTLTLLTPRENWDYTGQVGTLLESAGSIEKKYHYTMATDVLVTGVSGSEITTENAILSNQQSIYRLCFRYSVGPVAISAKSVTISGASGQLVQSQVLGGATTEGDISVTLGTATSDPFFVALRNGDQTNDEEFTFTVVDADGVTYRGTKTIPAAYKPNGTFVSAKNTTLTQRLDLALSPSEVITVL